MEQEIEDIFETNNLDTSSISCSTDVSNESNSIEESFTVQDDDIERENTLDCNFAKI